MNDSLSRSREQFEQAKLLFPGGVNSPVRAFGSVGGVPPFIVKAKGSRLFDVDGNEYIDYIGSWGVAILGHAHPNILAVLQHTIEHGTSFGAPTALETELASMMNKAIPSLSMLRFVNSGTEATMSAVRLARGFTGRSKIVKFEGCYHGHVDALLVKAGSGAATYGEPTSAGVPESVVRDTIVCRYNNFDDVTHVFQKMGNDIAAVIVEPVSGNMGCVPPILGFLEALRQKTQEHGTLLIFDEVMTGFRLGYSGAQGLYRITPDLTCLGKIIGGGLPIGAYGGRRDIMEKVAPLGPIYQAGTLSGNPLAMAAGIETLKLLAHPGTFEQLDTKTASLTSHISDALIENRIPHHINHIGSMWTLFFTKERVIDFASATTNDHQRFCRFFHAMLDAGIFIAPSPFESSFVSLAHSEEDIKETVNAVWQWAKKERG